MNSWFGWLLAGRRLARAKSRFVAAEAELKGVFAAMSDVVIVFDGTGRYLKVPSTSAPGLYAASNELVGRTIHDVLPPSEADEQLAVIRRAADSGEPQSYEYSLMIAEQVLWFNASVTRLNDNAVVWVARDVTQRRSLEAQLQQVHRMESVGMLAAGIAHDFNNILTAIGAHADFLMDELDETDSRHADAAEIKLNVARAAGLTRQLLAFGRKQILKPVKLDLNATVRQIGNMMSRVMGEEITIRMNFAEQLPPVLADATQVEQVLINLAMNARDALPEGGIITLTTANMVVDAIEAMRHAGLVPGEYVKVSVRDNGVGMTPEVQTRIFEPFFTTKDAGGGTGLGLSTVYGIVKQSNGFIYVSSAPGLGTTFEVLLPIAPEVSASDAEADLPRRGSCVIRT